VSYDLETKRRYLQIAIQEYEYSWASEYDKRAMTPRAISEGTVDFDYGDTDGVEASPDGAWVRARVWVPKSWL
jgi:hypothetical protein